MFSGAITAIILNVPGTPANIATVFDGYALTQKGEVRLALWVNTVFSVLGGLIGLSCFILASFPFARFALKFGPCELTLVALFGLTMMISVSGKDVLKGLLVGFIGLGISLIGMDVIWGLSRYTFGKVFLLDGISFIPIMIGMFGIGESLKQLYEAKLLPDKSVTEELKQKNKPVRKRLTLKEMWAMKIPFTLANVIGFIVGIIPGTGGDIASIVSWSQCKNISKERTHYGKGSVEGLAMTCTANNTQIGGAMTSMLTLGIPSDTVTAILLGALMMYNYTPGPLLFHEHPGMIHVIIILLFMCNIFIFLVGNISGRLFSKFVALPRSWIATLLILFSLVGSYALNNNALDVLVCGIAGVLGFFFYRAGFPIGPIVLALILGRMIESNFFRSLLLSKGSYAIFVTKPISLALVILIILGLFVPMVMRRVRKE
jgi:putative tricarboxylic transport membrane protein